MTVEKKVYVNQWRGDSPSSPMTCDVCDKEVTTAKLPIEDYSLWVCKGCLLDIVAEIDRAILESKNVTSPE